MDMTTNKEYIVPFSDMVEKLQQQNDYLSEGGTSYRQRTAELALKVAREVGDVTPFYNQIKASVVVAQLLPELDIHRKEDVAKMLRVVVNRLHLNATLSNDVKEYVNENMSGQEKIKLIEVKQ